MDARNSLCGGVTSNTLTCKRLDSENDTGDLSSALIDTLEAVEVSSGSKLLLLLSIGVFNKLDLLLDLTLGVVAGTGETADSAGSLLVSALSDKVPGA